MEHFTLKRIDFPLFWLTSFDSIPLRWFPLLASPLEEDMHVCAREGACVVCKYICVCEVGRVTAGVRRSQRLPVMCYLQ